MTASHPTAPLEKRILGSFLSALVGWIALMVDIATTTKPNTSPYLADMIGEFWGGVGMIEYLASILIFGIWLVVILPLYLLVPLSSSFWKWPICTICGAVGGATIMLIISRAVLSSSESWNEHLRLCIFAAGVGWLICLFASLTRRYFNTTRQKK